MQRSPAGGSEGRLAVCVCEATWGQTGASGHASMASASPPLDQGLKELNDAESPDEDGSDSQMQDAGSKAREEDESRAPPPPPPGAAASAVLSAPKVHLECPAQQLHVLGEYARALARVVRV